MSRPETHIATPELRRHTAWLVLLALGLAALVVVMATRNARIAVYQVLPTVLAMLLAGGAAARVLLRQLPRAPLWLMLLGPSLASWLGLRATVFALAVTHGRALDAVFARPVVERGQLAAPLLGALIGAAFWLYERMRRLEWTAWQRQQLDRAHHDQLERERVLAQMQLLQAQIEPHFLYNTLANLRHLVQHDSARALQMLDHLIRYFKLVLPSFRADRLPLGDELALVQAYLDLLRERLGREITLALDVPARWLAFPLLPGALLCLVENAVKHGLPEDGAALRLLIAARQEGEVLRLTVRDNGPGLGAEPGSGGTGLANLRERLRLLHGDGAWLQLHNAQPGCEAVLVVPCEVPPGSHD
ncbi:sensor histidine kinase [Aquabacterium sp.]|uniref:sensor histidine kinase n=1 Tax=Aquabacterium sp. TaxID=1872578 RepID=UPI003783AD0D